MARREPTTTEAEPGPEQGGGPPTGTAWTLVIRGGDDWEADLEHAAPVPRVGELVELINADGSVRRCRVVDVAYIVQPSATGRPTIREGRGSPNSIVADDHTDGPPRALRAGLPRVTVEEVDATG